MQVQVITVNRQRGIGKKSGNAYDFQTIGALISTAKGNEYCEFMLDADSPTPEVGKRYELEVQPYPDREKRLSFRVVALRGVATAKAA